MEDLFLEVVNAEHLDGYKLLVAFNNGERRTFDFAPLIARYPMFAPLEDIDLFKNFSVSDTVEWNGGAIDIAPEYIYEHGAKPYPQGEEFSASMAAEPPAPYGNPA